MMTLVLLFKNYNMVPKKERPANGPALQGEEKDRGRGRGLKGIRKRSYRGQK